MHIFAVVRLTIRASLRVDGASTATDRELESRAAVDMDPRLRGDGGVMGGGGRTK
jgi:hypothetical protein